MKRPDRGRRLAFLAGLCIGTGLMRIAALGAAAESIVGIVAGLGCLLRPLMNWRSDELR